MDKKVASAIIAVGIWLTFVLLFCALYIREAIHEAAPSADEIAAVVVDALRRNHSEPAADPFEHQHQTEKAFINGPGWRLENGKEVPVP